MLFFEHNLSRDYAHQKKTLLRLYLSNKQFNTKCGGCFIAKWHFSCTRLEQKIAGATGSSAKVPRCSIFNQESCGVAEISLEQPNSCWFNQNQRLSAPQSPFALDRRFISYNNSIPIHSEGSLREPLARPIFLNPLARAETQTHLT